MPVQVWKVFQGTDTQIEILLSGGIFTGSESLTTTVSRGDNQPVLTTLATAWNEPTATRPSLIATITAAQSLALRPGAYQTLVMINGTIAGDVGVLNVFAGTGGTGDFRSLITVPEAVLLVPDFQTIAGPVRRSGSGPEIRDRRHRGIHRTDADPLHVRPSLQAASRRLHHALSRRQAGRGSHDAGMRRGADRRLSARRG